MVDKKFYNNKGPFTLKKLSEYLGCKFSGDSKKIINDLATIEHANKDEICFFSNKKYTNFYEKSDAGVFVVSKGFKIDEKRNYLFSDNPTFDMAKLALLYYPESEYPFFSFQKDDETTNLDKSIKISNNCFIHKTAKIDKNCQIGFNTVIGPGVCLGKNCLVGDNVSIYYSIIGKNVKIYQGAKLGSEGFGFLMKKNSFKKIPQLGRVIIKDNVEIGANSTIDRGSIGDTVIGEYTMIDNIVHLAHNVRIGNNCIIAAMTGVAGSTVIGNNVVTGGQVGISGHLNIGNNVKIAAKTGILKDIEDNSVIGGYPSENILDWHRNTIILKKLRKNEKK
ncbi:MAG: UDP-3-O-(3-hydroxymyristoyl)glucosamine N-acyltransferase [Pseudomonadota bacterium]|nr:UDP-3-O-(3-hydroxymyristoyl)glucosamine N-acyltransferase [Pseudomonadota bacterium]